MASTPVVASANTLIDIPNSSKWWWAGGMSYGCGSVPEPSASGSKNRSCLRSETRHSLMEHTFPLQALPQSSVLVLQVEESITVISEQKKNNAKIRKVLDVVNSEVLDNEDRVTELQNVRLCNILLSSGHKSCVFDGRCVVFLLRNTFYFKHCVLRTSPN